MPMPDLDLDKELFAQRVFDSHIIAACIDAEVEFGISIPSNVVDYITTKLRTELPQCFYLLHKDY